MKRLLLPLIAASASFAQQPSQVPKLHSPDVQADGRVTFRYFDPRAQTVTVNLEGAKAPFAMQKDAAGIWTFTSDALAPELYGYSFTSDGAHRLDPENTRIKPNLLSLSNVVHVPGPSPLPWEDTVIPHGIIHHEFYKSAIVADNRDFYVYTPPAYDPNAATTYPVLYLLHGFSDDASGWTAVGKANLILDSLIAEGKAKPMIVVMPLGYGAPAILHPPKGSGAPFQDPALREQNSSKFTAALIEEVIPLVEKTYKADGQRDSRAIAGLSMGGAESLLTGLNHLDLFSWVGAFSAGGMGADFAAAFPNLDSLANSKLHVLWIACGTDDRLIAPNRSLIAWLQSKEIHVIPIETPGMHTWMVWRRNLIAFAPLLFRQTSASPSNAAAHQ
ncbi:MAG: alpha/beta hydrolase-fold protein [Acidobacteriota bacterium]|nr:alpha/beta hydrolase-fold protein [Acidobacteriota bacterium]